MPVPFLVTLAWLDTNSLAVAVCVLFAPVLAVAPVMVTVFVAVTDTVRALVEPSRRLRQGGRLADRPAAAVPGRRPGEHVTVTGADVNPALARRRDGELRRR